MTRQSNHRKRGASLRASVTVLRTRRQRRVADRTQVMAVFTCQGEKGAKADKARNLVTLTDQRIKRVKMELFGEKGIRTSLPGIASHPMIGVWATRRDALWGKFASFALRRALHGPESLV